MSINIIIIVILNRVQLQRFEDSDREKCKWQQPSQQNLYSTRFRESDDSRDRTDTANVRVVDDRYNLQAVPVNDSIIMGGMNSVWGDDDDVELNVLGCRADILGTHCDQRVCMVQYCFTSTETIRLIRTGSPRLSHSSWTLNNLRCCYVCIIRCHLKPH